MLSVTFAVMVWVPAGSDLESVAPVPRFPLKLDDQLILELMVPSGTSTAVPEKGIAAPALYEEPFKGLTSVKVGGVSFSGNVVYRDRIPFKSSEASVRMV